MKRDSARNAVVILTVAWTAMVVLFIYGVYSTLHPADPNAPLFVEMVKTYSALLGGVVIFVISLTLDYELGTVDLDAKTTLADLAHRLRFLRYRVKEDKSGLKVRISPSTVVRISTRTTTGRTVIRYKPVQTPTGWAAIVILGLTVYLSMIAPALTIAAIWKARKFANTVVLQQVEGSKTISTEGSAGSIRSALIDGLSEGYRLASEAYEAQYSNYQDGILAVITGALTVWFVGLVSFAALIKGQPLYSDWYASSIASLIVAVLFCTPLFLYLRRTVRAKALDLKAWSNRLLARLTQETSPTPPKDLEQSVFEVLDSVSRQIPKWMKTMRKAGMFTDPWTWLAIFLLAYATFETLLIGTATPLGSIARIAFFLVAGAMALMSYFLYTRWRAKQREEELEETTSWESRLRTMKERMQKHLEGL